MIDEVQIQTELDRILNDPDVPMHPSRVWVLADQLARHSGTANCANDTASTR